MISMIKEPRNEELTRNNIYDEYFRREVEIEKASDLRKDAVERIKKNQKLFEGKKTLEILIKGTVQFDKDFKKLFTFLNKTYNIEEGYCGEKVAELPNALHDLDEFNLFMNGNPINYFSEIENEYVNYTRVLNAHIFIELT